MLFQEPEPLEPCPWCRERISLEARVCPHCRRDVLLDLVIIEAVADGRTRYQIARDLTTVAAQPFQASLAALGEPGRVLLRAVTRSAARPVADILAGNEVAFTLGPAKRFHLSRMHIILSVGAVFIMLAFVYRWSVAADLAPRTAQASASASASGKPDAAPHGELTTTEIARTSLPGTVAIRAGNLVGSGFFVSPTHVLTNAHVVGTQPRIQLVFQDQGTATGVVERSDDSLDLALVRVEGRTGTPLPIGDAAAVQPGDRVVLIGSPMGLEFSVAEGGISNTRRQALGLLFLQTDAAVNPGNSGGPMLDRSGRVIGIVSMKVGSAEGVGLALPMSYATRGPNPFISGNGEPRQNPELEAKMRRAQETQALQESTLKLQVNRPLLGRAAAWSFSKHIEVEIGWLGVAPVPTSFKLKLDREGQALCYVEAAPEHTQTVELDRLPLPNQARESLKRAGVGDTIKSVRAKAPWRHCPPDAIYNSTLILVDGFEGADRVRMSSR